MNDTSTPPDAQAQPAGHPPVAGRRIGVLLVNLGTPDATDYWSMRRYLREFLSDPRVIETNRVVWWLILNLVILTIRPGRKGKDYDKIWNRERNESPLKTITRAQAEKLGQQLAGRYPAITVDWAMRYGNPSIGSRLAAMQAAGCDRILVVPLYPQYCAATTATVADKAFDALKTMRWQPSVRIAPPWHDDPLYIESVARSIEAELARLPFKPEAMLASFHGVPKDILIKGDPYYCHCHKTARLLRARLGLDEEQFKLTFQSRFGFAEWLQPYTAETVKALAERGVKNLAVVTPGFVAHCLETLEEIAGENAEIFHHHGGVNFAAIPCLNDSAAGIAVIEHVVTRELQGWLPLGDTIRP
ncbi:MAG: protoporphyrin/coproporphyrin ferrochelatase [Hyphomicrobiales bacterium]|jgi:ferrochelatase|nr:protoporphyrin/coproporphyrin ferrochelatase [Hyphomicrobiales bacterium]